MPAPLLATKLVVPPSGPIRVDRPDLTQRLDECLRPGCRLGLVSAPAGFGKITLIVDVPDHDLNLALIQMPMSRGRHCTGR